MRYRLHPGARRDLRAAARYYRDETDAALARRFLAEFEHTMTLLLDHPEIGAPSLSGKRRFQMRRFPFAVVYVFADDEIQVIAVAHHSRRPAYWRDHE